MTRSFRRRLLCVLCPVAAMLLAHAFGLFGGRARAAIIKGPHLQALRTDGITIIWEQENAGPGTVNIAGVDYPSPTSGTIHEVVITGLSPITQYVYTVTADGVTDGGSFTTAPTDPLTCFTFVAWGDNRSFHTDHQTMVDALIADAPVDFLINTGDMVASGEVAADWQFFFDIEYLLIKDTPWYPTVGNHEEHDGDVPVFFNNYLAPPTDTSGTEAYYSFTYANTAFIVLDGHVNIDSILFGLYEDFDAAQKAWMNSMLAQYTGDPTIQHVFVITHVPPYSSKSGRDGSHAVRLLHPTFAQYGIDAIVCGHDHYLEHGVSDPENLRYFTIGGGGAPRYTNESEGNLGWKPPLALPWFDDAHTVNFAATSLGYARFSICNGQVDVEIKDETGTILDTMSWNTGDVTPPDGGTPDAGVPGPDGGSLDAGLPGPDTGTPGPDTGSPAPDAASPGPDAASPGADAGTGPADEGGCKCTAAGGSPDAALGLWFLIALLALRRRRR